MSLCCKCGGIFANQPLKITKWGHFKDSKWSQHKIETFRGARDFFGPLNGTSDSEGHFGAQKVCYVLYSGIKDKTTTSQHLQTYPSSFCISAQVSYTTILYKLWNYYIRVYDIKCILFVCPLIVFKFFISLGYFLIWN